MRQGRRYIVSVVIGTLLLLPLLAIAFLQLGKAYLQFSREKRLNSEQLVQVIVPANKVSWEEEERELWIGDRMFDVSAYTIVDGNYHLTGAFDDAETEISGSLLHSSLAGNGEGLLQLLLLLQCFFGGRFLIQVFFNSRQKQQKQTILHAALPSPFYLVLVPPPRHLLAPLQ